MPQRVLFKFSRGEKRTPKEGYKSITVKAEVYDYYFNQWLKVKDEYTLKGIQSFSAYITHILFELMEQEKKKKP
jgi:hypothetical protein